MGQGLHYENGAAELYEMLMKMDCIGNRDITCEKCIFNVGSAIDPDCMQPSIIELFKKINDKHPIKKIEKIELVAVKTDLQEMIEKYEE